MNDENNRKNYFHEEDYYCIEFLLRALECDKKNEEHTIDIHEALILIAKTLFDLENKIDYIINLVPIKYKKIFPKPDENPFFKISISKPVEEYEKAKERMANLLKTVECKDKHNGTEIDKID